MNNLFLKAEMVKPIDAKVINLAQIAGIAEGERIGSRPTVKLYMSFGEEWEVSGSLEEFLHMLQERGLLVAK